MEMLTQPVLLMCLAMVLAIGIERLLELLRAFRDYIEAKRGHTDIWQKRAENIRDRIEVRLNNSSGTSKLVFEKLLMLVYKNLVPSSSDNGGLIAISASTVRKMYIKIRYKLIAIVFGIIFACLFDLNIFELVDQATAIPADKAKDLLIGNLIRPPEWVGYLVSGIAMGFGAGPVHKMITALERARKFRRGEV